MNSISKPTPIDIFQIVLVAVIWGSAFTSIKIAIADIGPLWAATGRVTIGFLSLLPFCLIMGFASAGSLRGWMFFLLIACLNIVVPFVFISWGLQHVGAGTGSLLMGIGPFVALVLSHFFTADDRINFLKALAVIIGLSGILLIVGGDAVYGLKSSALIAQIAILASSSSYVISGLLIRRVKIKAVPFGGMMLGLASLCLLAVTLLVEGMPQQLPSQKGWIALLWLGIVPTGLAYIMRFYLVQRVGVSMFSVGMNIVPVCGVVIAALVLGEVVDGRMLAALACVLVGLSIARLGSTANARGNDSIDRSKLTPE